MKAIAYAGLTSFLLVVMLASGRAQGTFFSENFGTGAGTSPSALTEIPPGWTKNPSGLDGATGGGPWGLLSNSPSSGYAGASAGNNCYVENRQTTGSWVKTPAINASSYVNDTLKFGVRFTGANSNPITLTVEYSTDNSTFTLLTGGTLNHPGNANWALKVFPLPAAVNSAHTLYIRWTATGSGSPSNSNVRIDDVQLRWSSTILNDGDGTATLSNSTAGILNGSTILNRATAAQTVTVSVLGTLAGSLDTVRLTVPSSFTGFAGSNVTLGGAFSGKNKSIAGNSITVLSAGLTDTSAGTIRIVSLTSPNPNTAGANGNDTWLVATAKSGGTLTGIFSSPVSYTIIPIQNLRTGGTDGLGNSDAGGTTPVLLNNTVAVQGVITVPNRVLAETTSTNIVIQDVAYGIVVAKDGSDSHLSLLQGNTIVVKGSVNASHGNTEIHPASVTTPDLFNVGGSTTISPTVLAGATNVTEVSEGKLVKLNSVNWDSAGQSFIASSGSRGIDNFMTGVDSGTIYLNAVNDAVGNSIPPSSAVTGVVYHRDDLTGAGQKIYKIAPRNQLDLGFSAADGTGTATISPFARLINVNAIAETLTIAGDGTNTLGGVSVAIPSTWTWTNTASRTLTGVGFTGATSSITGDGSASNPYVVTVSNANVTNTNTGKLIVSNLNTPSSGSVTTFVVKTRGAAGILSVIASSPAVIIATSGFEAVATGNWSNPLTWAGRIVPGVLDDASMSTLGVVVTVDIANAQCHNLTMTGSGSASNSGPVLQFAPAGSSGMTINGDLSISGGSGGGSGDHGGRGQLTSNGNASATLVIKHNIATTSSNATSAGNGGLNMNEGTVKLVGSTTDSLKNSAGFRMGNLQIGDGIASKTLVWTPTKVSTMSIRSLLVKKLSTFSIGAANDSTANNIGNASSSGVPTLTGGITIDSGAAMIVQDFTGGVNNASINIDGGGITNNGTLDLTTAVPGPTSRERIPSGFLSGSNYTVNFGGFSQAASSATQTIAGTNVGQFADVVVGAGDTLTLHQDMSIPSLYTMTLDGTLAETPGNTVIGAVVAVRKLADSTDETFGGIGATINAAGSAPDTTTVTRVTGVAQTGGSNSSIQRYFDIVPKVNVGLNATFDFTYDASELNGHHPSTLQLWRSADDGTSWTPQASVADSALHRVHAVGIDGFSRWTASDVSKPLGISGREVAVMDGWNMLSVPVTVAEYLKTSVFPSAVSKAFAYSNGYVIKDTLENRIGYWIKFSAAETLTIDGAERVNDTIDVATGWNMIGTISDSVAVGSITQIPSGIVASSYFGFGIAGYAVMPKLVPGYSYWVKTNAPGKLVLHVPGAVPKTMMRK